MFRRCLLSILLFISISQFSYCQPHAQEEQGEIIIISQRVGKGIEQEEREKFKSFPDIKGFQPTVLLKMPHSRPFLKMPLLAEKTEELKIGCIQQLEASMKNYRNKINYFDDIQARERQNLLERKEVSPDSSKKKKVYFTIRWGQGGFWDDRSPSGKFSGDQGALDIKLAKLPIAMSLLVEVYYGGRYDDRSEERVELRAVNVLYMSKLFRVERLNVFLGGGIGRLGVNKEWPNGTTVKSSRCTLYNLEAGINIRAFWMMGFYVLGKYIYAQKRTDNIKVIDFKEPGFLFGLTINFAV